MRIDFGAAFDRVNYQVFSISSAIEDNTRLPAGVMKCQKWQPSRSFWSSVLEVLCCLY